MSGALRREGDLYKVYKIDGHVFEIRYGYYADNERGRLDPLPIYPNLNDAGLYNREGQPIVTMVQEPCNFYRSRSHRRPDNWCGDCQHYAGGDEEIGICSCLQLRQSTMRSNE